jgi:hypothetical protein
VAISRQKAGGVRGDNALITIKRYVGGGACYYQFPRMSLLGSSVNIVAFTNVVQGSRQNTALPAMNSACEVAQRGGYNVYPFEPKWRLSKRQVVCTSGRPKGTANGNERISANTHE